jgi:hypothetical protein
VQPGPAVHSEIPARLEQHELLVVGWDEQVRLDDRWWRPWAALTSAQEQVGEEQLLTVAVPADEADAIVVLLRADQTGLQKTQTARFPATERLCAGANPAGADRRGC